MITIPNMTFRHHNFFKKELEIVLSAKMVYFCKTNLLKKQIGISLQIAQVMFTDGKKSLYRTSFEHEKKNVKKILIIE